MNFLKRIPARYILNEPTVPGTRARRCCVRKMNKTARIAQTLLTYAAGLVEWCRRDKLYYSTARAFAVLATPFGMLSGAAENAKLYLRCLWHSSARCSRSSNSIMGQPQPASSTSCRLVPARCLGGHASKALVSPPTTEKDRSQSQRSVLSLPSSPMKDRTVLWPKACCSSSLNCLYCFVKPKRTSSISPTSN